MTIVAALLSIADRRAPNVTIGPKDDPYMRRWWVIPRNRFFNIYLHQFLRSDDDRALHNHPWVNLSILLKGTYVEHREGGILKPHKAGDVVVRLSGKIAHRIELDTGPCWTLFITGPRYREWGFLCPKGFVHWKDFTKPGDSSEVGKGCD